MSELRRPRRYYLGKRYLTVREHPDGRGALDAVFKVKQESEPGTVLPSDFPFRAKLESHFYTTIEDLDGADEHELRHNGFSGAEARIILKQLAVLTA